jgi:hypothetical protein
MKTSLIRTAAALLLGGTAMLSQAATVNLSTWAFGSGNGVSVGAPNHTGPAGGFKGSVTFAAGGESGFSTPLTDFITYCVELDQSFSLPSGDMRGYSVVAGASYDLWNSSNARNPSTGNTAAGTADRLGKLLTYVGSNSGIVDTAAESTSLQLAIWNVIYDSDEVLDTGSFIAGGTPAQKSYNSYANTLLANSATFTNTLDVFVLTRDDPKSQDFLLTRQRLPGQDIPEPASLALSLLGLAAAGAVSRRRRQRA